jgi:SAM-dependent methyltransferase
MVAPTEIPGTGSIPDEDQRRQRRALVVDTLAEIICPSRSCGTLVVIHDATEHGGGLADDLAEAVQARGEPCARLPDPAPLIDRDVWRHDRASRTVVIADGSHWRSPPPTGRRDILIYLRTPPPPSAPPPHTPPPQTSARQTSARQTSAPHTPLPDTPQGHGDGEHGADIVIDYHDPSWPVIRHVADHLDHAAERIYLTETRAFFAARAATWDHKFGRDLPAYAAAVTEAAIPAGATVVDVGCGTGRCLDPLRDAVGPYGVVIGIDLTPHMLAVASRRPGTAARLLLADARRLPLCDASADAVFAAGLIQHLPDPAAGLAELARITRPTGRLVIFHPSGRAALAARHGRTLRDDEPLNEPHLRGLLTAAGWTLVHYDDAPHRFFALAARS